MTTRFAGVADRDAIEAESAWADRPKPGTVHALLAEHRQRLFPDVFFADLFRSGRGRPSVPAEVVPSKPSMSLVAIAITSPVRRCWKKRGPCRESRAYNRVRSSTPRWYAAANNWSRQPTRKK